MKTITAFIILTILAGPALSQSVQVSEPAACLECHADLEPAFDMAHVHAAFEDGTCSSCHNPHATKHAGLLNDDQAALCAECHGDVADEVARRRPHVPAGRGECILCHDPHASGNAALMREEVPGLCVGCHSPVAEWLAKDVVHQPLKRGACDACHESHGSDDESLLTSRVPGLCMDCHQENDRMLTAHKGRSFAETDCTACHDPHASSMKGLVRENQHKPFASGNCARCHGESSSSFAVTGGIQEMCLDCHKTQTAYRRADNKHIMTSTESCVACHNPHAANGAALLKADQIDLCMSCHFNDMPNPDKAHYVTHDGMECVTCHAPHGNGDEQLLVTRGASLCAGCHERAHQVSHPIGDDIIDPRTGVAVTCLSCHQLHGADFTKYLPLNPDMALCIQCHKK